MEYITKKDLIDCSTPDEFCFSLCCMECKTVWKSTPIRFSKAGKQYSKELKLELVKKHLEDGISYWKLGKEYGIEASIIRRWGHKYETFGEDGLEKQNADLCN